ncbi:ring-cleaving dioxygenase [Agrilactobacillus fermenti]|uniref:ring-cleaving dioxygenase n=1 Tax=Agrilactobacillus fermenti TaxID=2586909 RepID=UPI001E41798F|nr:ring-cleaving dioxygenase [Agrilactobacillus fermenti]MCD2256670.1 ring-cleaving dioxygenase [Agrilactobacillus fermenti]
MDNENLLGLHHVTAITSDAQKIFNFMSKLLGLHLIKKTVNQDDVSAYHLYFTDDMGTAGTDITFFEFPHLAKGKKGTNLISRIGFRVPNDAALTYWTKRFEVNHITHSEIKTQFRDKIIQFEDFDGQQYQLVSDEHNSGISGGTPFKKSDVPAEFAIVGLGPVQITVFNQGHLNLILTELMGFTQNETEGAFTRYELNNGGHGAEVIMEHREDVAPAEEGYGNVHHLAFRVSDETVLRTWIEKIKAYRLPQSGFVDRFYFKSEYFRAAPQILFEIATDGPGFLQDETYDEAGIHLELPPFLENRRSEIEAGLTPIKTELK